jgi:hypothetical protein
MKYPRTFKFLIVPAASIGLSAAFAGGAIARSDKHTKNLSGPVVERVIAADPGATVSACLVSGDIKVHGWDRNEVRARSNGAAAIEFRRPAGGRESEPAKEITVLVADTSAHRSGACSLNGDLELDVPRGATVRLQTRDGNIQVFDVSMVSAAAQAGDLTLEGVKRSVEARSIGGNVALRNSTGSTKLHSVGGNIEARDVGSTAAGDTFEATTVGGDITLEKTVFAGLEAKTVSGTLSLSGPLAVGGRYDFKTISGDITLTLPPDSSFRLDAKLSRGGELVTEFPLRITTEPGGTSPQSSRRSGPAAKGDSSIDAEALVKGSSYGSQHINGVYGTGDALITAYSFSGAIKLRKK